MLTQETEYKNTSNFHRLWNWLMHLSLFIRLTNVSVLHWIFEIYYIIVNEGICLFVTIQTVHPYFPNVLYSVLYSCHFYTMTITMFTIWFMCTQYLIQWLYYYVFNTHTHTHTNTHTHTHIHTYTHYTFTLLSHLSHTRRFVHCYMFIMVSLLSPFRHSQYLILLVLPMAILNWSYTFVVSIFDNAYSHFEILFGPWVLQWKHILVYLQLAVRKCLFRQQGKG